MRILALESSCDETAAAVVENGRNVLANVVLSQIAAHRPYGGVVPEIACRAHLEEMSAIVAEALKQSKMTFSDLDGIAVTHGPGLASSLLMGISTAKALAMATGLPLYPVNHLHGHIASVFLGDDAPEPDASCPMLLLLATGGHSNLIRIRSWGEFDMLGRTIDDAAGEALDKGAKLLGLGYPGGPEVEALAQSGDAKAVAFPYGLAVKGDPCTPEGLKKRLCFTFSGLKTSLMYHLKKFPEQAAGPAAADVAASYQQAVMKSLIQPMDRALAGGGYQSVACVGGVAKNKVLRGSLDDLAERYSVPLHLAQMQYCTDNAAMIAAAGCRMIAAGLLEPDNQFDATPSLAV